jgi:hypothetical protein
MVCPFQCRKCSRTTCPEDADALCETLVTNARPRWQVVRAFAVQCSRANVDPNRPNLRCTAVRIARTIAPDFDDPGVQASLSVGRQRLHMRALRFGVIAIVNAIGCSGHFEVDVHHASVAQGAGDAPSSALAVNVGLGTEHQVGADTCIGIGNRARLGCGSGMARWTPGVRRDAQDCSRAQADRDVQPLANAQRKAMAPLRSLRGPAEVCELSAADSTSTGNHALLRESPADLNHPGRGRSAPSSGPRYRYRACVHRSGRL